MLNTSGLFVRLPRPPRPLPPPATTHKGRTGMPSWNESSAEQLNWKLPNGQTDFDGYRRSKYKALADHTGRPLIVYATDFLNRAKVQAAGGDVSIDLTDREGVREGTHSLKSKTVHLIIHSPTASPEAPAAIRQVLRS